MQLASRLIARLMKHVIVFRKPDFSMKFEKPSQLPLRFCFAKTEN
jgi:hypothetical protein